MARETRDAVATSGMTPSLKVAPCGGRQTPWLAGETWAGLRANAVLALNASAILDRAIRPFIVFILTPLRIDATS